VAGASVYGNAEKATMVHRLLTGLGAAGSKRALMSRPRRRSVTIRRPAATQ
jgi:hypothetical protein